MASFARHLVSKKKRRFIEDGFDLDLVFITENLVAMGFPAQGKESLYRNPLGEVQRFLGAEENKDKKLLCDCWVWCVFGAVGVGVSCVSL